MFKSFKLVAIATLLTGLLVVAASAQQTTGTVNLSGAVSKFVEINSGGAVILAGNSGGSVTTDGTVDTPLAVVVNLGELGPSNTNSFVTATVPLKLRSNAVYNMTMIATFTGSAASLNGMTADDIGFGLGATTRAGTGVHTAGIDANNTSGDPTLPANGAVNAGSGRFEYITPRSNLGAFAASTQVLSGPRILNAVPRANGNGLTVPAIFSVKPQFYEDGTMTATATFTVTAP